MYIRALAMHVPRVIRTEMTIYKYTRVAIYRVGRDMDGGILHAHRYDNMCIRMQFLCIPISMVARPYGNRAASRCARICSHGLTLSSWHAGDA